MAGDADLLFAGEHHHEGDLRPAAGEGRAFRHLLARDEQLHAFVEEPLALGVGDDPARGELGVELGALCGLGFRLGALCGRLLCQPSLVGPSAVTAVLRSLVKGHVVLPAVGALARRHAGVLETLLLGGIGCFALRLAALFAEPGLFGLLLRDALLHRRRARLRSLTGLAHAVLDHRGCVGPPESHLLLVAFRAPDGVRVLSRRLELLVRAVARGLDADVEPLERVTLREGVAFGVALRAVPFGVARRRVERLVADDELAPRPRVDRLLRRLGHGLGDDHHRLRLGLGGLGSDGRDLDGRGRGGRLHGSRLLDDRIEPGDRALVGEILVAVLVDVDGGGELRLGLGGLGAGHHVAIPIRRLRGRHDGFALRREAEERVDGGGDEGLELRKGVEHDGLDTCGDRVFGFWEPSAGDD